MNQARLSSSPSPARRCSARNYSNFGYLLLGAIIEKISGVSYPKFVEQRLFVPLGMSSTCFALRLPEQQLFVAVLSNADVGIVDPAYIAHKIGAVAIGAPLVEFDEIELDAGERDAYAGVYTVNASEQRTFWRDAGQLLMLRTGGDVTPVHPHSSTVFFIRNTLVHLEFVRDAGGAVAKVVLYQHGEINENPRVTA